MEDVESLKQRLVAANRILANEGIIEGFGHVSARHPDGDKLLIAESVSPRFVTEEDIITMKFDGTIVDKPNGNPYMETVIHRAIMRNRDDVGSVVHHHAPAVIPFTATDKEIKPIFHMGALFHDGIETFSDYDMEYGYLIATEDEGKRMAEELGDKRAQLLENHGANVTGLSLKESILSTVYLVKNAQYQYYAEKLGNPTYYDESTDAMETMVDDVILDPVPVNRMWSYLINRLPDSHIPD